VVRRFVAVAFAGVLAIFIIAGCGTSTGGGTGPVPTATQPVGPAAPPAARGQETVTRAAVESAAGVTVFLLASGGKFDSISLPLAKVSLLRAGGAAVPLEIVPDDHIRPDSFALIARGNLPPAGYDGLIAQPAKKGSPTITPAAGKPARSLRLPETIDLKFDLVKTSATEHLILVVTLDCKGLTGKAPLDVAGDRFHAVPLSEDQAAGIKGRVAPSSSLAHVCACWAKGGVVVAATQADAFTGDYSFAKLPPGEYVVRITAAGYNTYQGPDKPIAVAAGKTADLPPVVLLSSHTVPGM
jgi:hypothetical protein